MGEVIEFRPRQKWCPVCWERLDERDNCPMFHLAAHTEPLLTDPAWRYRSDLPWRG